MFKYQLIRICSIAVRSRFVTWNKFLIVCARDSDSSWICKFFNSKIYGIRDSRCKICNRDLFSDVLAMFVKPRWIISSFARATTAGEYESTDIDRGQSRGIAALISIASQKSICRLANFSFSGRTGDAPIDKNDGQLAASRYRAGAKERIYEVVVTKGGKEGSEGGM